MLVVQLSIFTYARNALTPRGEYDVNSQWESKVKFSLSMITSYKHSLVAAISTLAIARQDMIFFLDFIFSTEN